MEKNALLAVALSILVFLAWSHFFGSRVEQPSPEKPAEREQALPRPVVPQDPVVRPADLPELRPGVVSAEPVREIREVVVEHPLYRAVLSEMRGEVVSFQLKQYRESVDSSSPWLEMFKSGTRSPQLAFFKGSVPDLDSARFEADQTRLDVTPTAGPRNVTFSWTSADGIRLVKRYTFYPDSYLMDLDVILENGSEGILDDNLEVRLIGAPFETKKGYYNTTEAAALVNNTVESQDAQEVKQSKIWAGDIRWTAYQDNFFLKALIPVENIQGSVRVNRVDPAMVRLDLVMPPVNLLRNMAATYRYHLYFGPKQLDTLKSLNLGLDRAVDYGWFDVIAKPILFVLNWVYNGLKNYGLAIIVVTILIKILFWPLTQKSYKSMKAMQKLQPEMARLREQHKDNKQRLNAELMTLYKTHKVNPMGGCLPMLIQIPVFIALYRLLGESIEMRHAPFMLWINDLSAPDRLYIGFDIPYTGGLPVLTLLMGLSMFIQQKMTPTPGDPTQAKIMLALPVVFTFLFINFPSGLVLYWLMNNVLSIGQQYLINKKA